MGGCNEIEGKYCCLRQNTSKLMRGSRYMLDTNIFIYLASDPESLSEDVRCIIEDYENEFYMSAESMRELVVGYRKKRFSTKRWKTPEEMLRSITNDFNIWILPLKEEHMLTLSRLLINEAEDHNDPSDHVIIAHAITEHLPLISSDHKFLFYRNQGLDLVFNK